MSRVLTNEQNYYDIANTIRQMKNVNTTYKPREMASALKDIYSNEVEGTLPLSFEANGNNLLNYRIDGASGGVGDRTGNLFDKKNTEIIHAYFTPENLWQVNEDSSSIIIKVRPNTQYTLSIGTAISIFRIYKTSLENPEPGKSNVFTPIIRSSNINTYTFTTDNDITYIIFQGTNADTEMWINSLILNIGSTSLPSYEPYGYKVPVVVNGKNLLQNNATTQTRNGVTFTVNNDKSITCNGTASGNAFFKIGDIQLKKNCIMSGCPENGGNNSYIMRLYNNGSILKTDSGNGVLINSEIQNGYAEIRIAAGYTCDNLTFYPMIRLASIEDDTYEPYIEPTTTNIYLDNPIRTINDEVEYIDYSEQKHHRVRKNLLQNTATTQTVNGVTFTVNNDKSITCNGTATGTTAITINTIFSINSTKISGCPMGGSWSSFELDLLNINTNNVDVIDTGNGAVIQNENSYRVRIRIASGYTCNNLTFYPMIRKADIEDDTYEPYIENTEVDVTLPAIPTLDGTNTLSIGTTVQPSNVYIQAPKDSIEATQIANELEEI